MLLQERIKLIWMVHLLQAAYVWRPVQDLRHDARAALRPVYAPFGAGAIQLVCMLMRLHARGLSI